VVGLSAVAAAVLLLHAAPASAQCKSGAIQCGPGRVMECELDGRGKPWCCCVVVPTPVPTATPMPPAAEIRDGIPGTGGSRTSSSAPQVTAASDVPSSKGTKSGSAATMRSGGL